MAKGVKRSFTNLAQGANTAQAVSLLGEKDEEIEALKERIRQLEAGVAGGTTDWVWIDVNLIEPMAISVTDGSGKVVEIFGQPRKFFDLEGMAQSLRIEGQQDPVVLRTVGEGRYQLLDGETRWRTIKDVLGQAKIKARFHECSDEEALAYTLVGDALKNRFNALEQGESIVNLLRSKLKKTEQEIVSLLYRIQNQLVSKGNEKEAIEWIYENVDGSEIVLRLLSSLNITIATMVNARLPLMSLPEKLKESINNRTLTPSNALILRNAPEAIWAKAIEGQNGTMPKRKMKMLINKLALEMGDSSPTLAANDGTTIDADNTEVESSSGSGDIASEAKLQRSVTVAGAESLEKNTNATIVLKELLKQLRTLRIDETIENDDKGLELLERVTASIQALSEYYQDKGKEGKNKRQKQ
ncbi:ParB/RepB/Spo0J family partition protein [Nodosilinea sp. PGN35]|uniref:ParB/RepB/Spo0J family partition protein n=1 Tax=Nodosilinea sp. PGN35 TaxID=3020489 RepID=UPI00398B997B